MSKTNHGNYFEDFHKGQILHHATPRTITEGDVSLYTALYGNRFAVQSADSFAIDIGYEAAPVDDFLVFHMVFGKTVADISLNAVANLGYADCRFIRPVYPGDSVSTTSEIIGVKQNSNGKTGVLYVRSIGRNQMNEVVLDYVRWVMVKKKDPDSPAPERTRPTLPERVDPANFAECTPELDLENYNNDLAGSPYRWGDYEVGEKIDHIDGMTIEEAEHQMATRLYQNTAKVHFNNHKQMRDRYGRRLVYGGHVISIARALSFNGLANGFHVAAINGGHHVAPCFAGYTMYAWSEILEKAAIPGRDDIGALRVRTIAAKNHPCSDFPYEMDEGYHEDVLLVLDYWLVMPR